MVVNSANEPLNQQQVRSGAATQHPNYGAMGAYGISVGQSNPLDQAQGGYPSAYTAEPHNRVITCDPAPMDRNNVRANYVYMYTCLFK